MRDLLLGPDSGSEAARFLHDAGKAIKKVRSRGGFQAGFPLYKVEAHSCQREKTDAPDRCHNLRKELNAMKTKSTLTKLLSALVLAAILSVCAATSAQAGPELHLSGMFGVAEGQVARINAVNLGGPDTRPIQIEMQFIDAMGNVVARDTKTI